MIVGCKVSCIVNYVSFCKCVCVTFSPRYSLGPVTQIFPILKCISKLIITSLLFFSFLSFSSLLLFYFFSSSLLLLFSSLLSTFPPLLLNPLLFSVLLIYPRHITCDDSNVFLPLFFFDIILKNPYKLQQ